MKLRFFGHRQIAIYVCCISLFAQAAVADQVAIVNATADGFVREQDPSSNFGAAGLLCVAGANSVNGSGQPRGRFDSLLMFDVSTAVSGFNSSLGIGNWEIANASLEVTLVAAPENPLFPRGPGNFAVAWISDDSWTEGSGTPNAPTIGTGNEITWQLLQSILPGATEANLGTFSYSGISGTQDFSLSLATTFVSDIKSAGFVSLHVTPQTSDIGMPFHSLNFSDPLQQPALILTATPILHGDLNCDQVIDNLDIPAFVLSLLNPPAYSAAFPSCNIHRADMDGNGLEDAGDIAGFVAALLND